MTEEKKYRILVVEDESAMAEVLECKFKREGFKILLAKNGLDGLNIAKKMVPDIILLDIVMPIMDGITMLEKLRKEKIGKKIPVIMLTNLCDAERIEDARKQRVNDYLVKANWRLEDVVKVVKDRLAV